MFFGFGQDRIAFDFEANFLFGANRHHTEYRLATKQIDIVNAIADLIKKRAGFFL